MTKSRTVRPRSWIRAFCLFAVAPAALGSIGLGAALGAFTEDKDTRVIAYNTYGDATARCPGDKHVNFGGFKLDTQVPFGSGGYTWPASMAPKGSDTDKWSVAAEASSANGGKVTSFAYCKGGSEPKVVRHKQIVLPSAANDEFRNVKVSCPAGKHVIGGGWAAQTSTLSTQRYLEIMGLKRTSDDTWQVSVENATGVQQGVTAIALCGKGSAPKTVTATENLPALNGSKTVTATCPTGKEAVFGGFKGDYDSLSGRNAFIFSFYLSSKREITVHGGQNSVAGNHAASKLQAIAYCR